jgi:hypothetical protein
MTAIDIEKLNQLMSRNDMTGNDKVKWLIEFIDDIESQLKQQGQYAKKLTSEEITKYMDDMTLRVYLDILLREYISKIKKEKQIK